jgi:hypothetical protein
MRVRGIAFGAVVNLRINAKEITVPLSVGRNITDTLNGVQLQNGQRIEQDITVWSVENQKPISR